MRRGAILAGRPAGAAKRCSAPAARAPWTATPRSRIMHRARCLARRTEKGRAYGQITAKAVAVLEAILWTFHNAGSGLCFPSYERIAEAAGCARSTVAEAVSALEAAGLLTWVNRIKRVRERCADLLGPGGWRWRVLRTSNAYEPIDPGAPVDRPASKSEKPTGTEDPRSFPFQELARRSRRSAYPGSSDRYLESSRSSSPLSKRLITFKTAAAAGSALAWRGEPDQPTATNETAFRYA